MNRLVTSIVLVFSCLLAAACTSQVRAPAADGPLILVSIDAFRWDFLQEYDAPTLRRLAAGGVHATRMSPCFPSKTFPNHLSLVTGLYPAHHGIVSNEFYDPDLGATFNKNHAADNVDPRWWQQGEPVWITAEKQGVHAACILWPGDEAEIHGRRPSYYQRFDKSLNSDQRVDSLLAQLALPAEQRPRLCALYLDVVDHNGHTYGPDAPEMAVAVREADTAIARLLAGLDKLGLRSSANLVIVSDHGLSACGPDRVIFLEDLMDVAQVQVESTGANGGVAPKTGTAAELVARIRARAPPQLHAYLREETPERLHYRENPRIPPVVLIADDHWMIESKVGWPNFVLTYNRGNHGWDPALPNMGALFIANGPAFRHGTEIPDFENIHLYNLLCATLGLTPAPNDGDQRLARAVLRR
jgi:predicted AlkP superfamily pyrophosphatase or phosphodiesterase